MVDFLAGRGSVPYDPDNKAEVAEFDRIVEGLADESRRAFEQVDLDDHFIAMVAEEFVPEQQSATEVAVLDRIVEGARGATQDVIE